MKGYFESMLTKQSAWERCLPGWVTNVSLKWPATSNAVPSWPWWEASLNCKSKEIFLPLASYLVTNRKVARTLCLKSPNGFSHHTYSIPLSLSRRAFFLSFLFLCEGPGLSHTKEEMLVSEAASGWSNCFKEFEVNTAVFRELWPQPECALCRQT